MLRRLMDKYAKTFDRDFVVCFANTGREHNATLDFGHEVEARWGVQIVWLEYCRDENGNHSQRVVNYETASRRGQWGAFDEYLSRAKSLPSVGFRGCSSDLKTRPMKRWLKSQGVESWNDYIGIRADESLRTLQIRSQCPKYIVPHFPLDTDGITKRDVDAFWDAQPFKLNIPNYRGNCDLCFLKAKWKRLAIMRDEPEHAQWWIEQERKMRARGVTGNGALWIEGQSYEGHMADATHPEFQFDTTEQDIACSCVEKGYLPDEDKGLNHY